jgi:hypothetical protein
MLIVLPICALPMGRPHITSPQGYPTWEVEMARICFCLSAAMTGAGLATSDAFGHMFAWSGVLLIGASFAFNYLLGENS